MGKTSTATNLNFSVSGEYLTDFIRTRCLEGKPRHAFEVFRCIMPPEGHQINLMELFQSLIKGTQAFQGTNDLSLTTGSGQDLTSDVLHNLRHQKREYADVYSQDDEFDAQEYNDQVDKDETERMAEFNFFCEQMNLSLSQVEDIYLKTKHSDNYAHPQGGWVTPQGYFIPVPFQNHEEVFHNLRDEGYTFHKDVSEVEQKWIRISNDSIADFMKSTAIRPQSPYTFNLSLSAKQRLTLEKIIIARGLLQEGQSLEIYGFGEVFLENGHCKFIKRRF
jgi:predicted HicB family RNase H-like nuclease